MVEKIRELAATQGFSLNDLERQLTKVGVNTIYRWDDSSPAINKVAEVADYFGVSLDYLVGRDPQGGRDAELTARIHRLTGSQRQAVEILIDGFLAQSPLKKDTEIS